MKMESTKLEKKNNDSTKCRTEQSNKSKKYKDVGV